MKMISSFWKIVDSDLFVFRMVVLVFKRITCIFKLIDFSYEDELVIPAIENRPAEALLLVRKPSIICMTLSSHSF